MNEQYLLYGMILALLENDGDGDAYLTLDRAAESSDYGDEWADAVLLGASMMCQVIEKDDHLR